MITKCLLGKEIDCKSLQTSAPQLESIDLRNVTTSIARSFGKYVCEISGTVFIFLVILNTSAVDAHTTINVLYIHKYVYSHAG